MRGFFASIGAAPCCADVEVDGGLGVVRDVMVEARGA